MSQYFVAPDGSNSNNGTSRLTAFLTINKALSVMVSGDHLAILPGTYRETVIVDVSNVTIEGMFSNKGLRPVIKGSEVFTGWTLHAGSVWKKIYTTPARGSNPDHDPTFYNFGRVRQVFFRDSRSIDAGFLERVGDLPSMTAKTFYNDDVSKTVYVWMENSDNPNDYTMECSLRGLWLRVNGDHVLVRNLECRHGAITAWSPGNNMVTAGGGDRIEYCDFSWGDFGCTLYGTSGCTFYRCRFACMGDTGVGGVASGHLLEECLCEYNNQRKWQIDWHAGNKSAALVDSIIRRCIFRFSLASGLWTDFSHNNLIEECLCYGNMGPGIVIEIGQGNRLQNNVCILNCRPTFEYKYILPDGGAYGAYLPTLPAYTLFPPSRPAYEQNEGRGIYISSSQDTIVEHNFCAFNTGSGIESSGPARQTTFYDTEITVANRRNTIRSNVSVFNTGAQLGVALNGVSPEIVSNVCDYNLVFAIGAPVASVATLLDWLGYSNGQPGGAYDLHSIEGQPMVRNQMLFDYRLLPQSPGHNAAHDGLDMGITKDLTTLPFNL